MITPIVGLESEFKTAAQTVQLINTILVPDSKKICESLNRGNVIAGK